MVLSCPRSSYFDYKTFNAVVITPYEAAIAFDEIPWTGDILLERGMTDIKAVLETKKEEQEVSQEKWVVALREKHQTQLALFKEDKQLALRTILPTYEHFTQRTYQGLEIDQEVKVTKATKGKVGIAMGYKDIQ